MGQHRQALDIYVFKLQDPIKAEEYCNQVYLKEIPPQSSPTQTRHLSTVGREEATTSIYHTLLSLYLTPPSPHKPQWEPALDILAKHGARMPASSTLDLIPEVLPIKDLGERNHVDTSPRWPDALHLATGTNADSKFTRIIFPWPNPSCEHESQ